MCVDASILKQGDCSEHWDLISIIFPIRNTLMIILRNMGTIHYWQAALPVRESHVASVSNLISNQAVIDGQGQRVDAYFVNGRLGSIDASRSDLCWAHMARGWWAGFYRVVTRRGHGGIAASRISCRISAAGKMGYSTAASIFGQSRATYPDSDTYGYRSYPDVVESRSIAGDDTSGDGTNLTRNGVTPAHRVLCLAGNIAFRWRA